MGIAVTASASFPWTIPNRVSSKQISFLLSFEYYIKKKTVPLQARGAQRVPGSKGSQIT